MAKAFGLAAIVREGLGSELAGSTDVAVQGDLLEGFGLARPRSGRPKGSENRSTKQTRQFLLQQYGSPLDGMMDMAAMLTEPRRLMEFASAFGMDPPEAVKLCLMAASTVAPYVHQKLPQASEGDGRTPQPMVVRIGGERPVIPARPRLVDPVAEADVYQRVSSLPVVQSDGVKSDDATNALIVNEEVADAT